jgi:general secretion pathway protein F
VIEPGNAVPAYRYEAVDARGRARRGLVDADSSRQVRDQLRGEGLFPTAIEAANSIDHDSAGIGRTRLSPEMVSLTTRLLATLVRSGMPLDVALSAVAEQADDASAEKLFTALRAQVASGETLAAALARWPRTFSSLYRGLVAVGAETGRLSDVLARLADYLEERQALKQKFTMALIYPALVTLIALAVIAVLLVYVAPQVVSVYQQSRQTLPWLTQALIAFSGFVRATAWYWLACIAAGAAAFSLANRR